MSATGKVLVVDDDEATLEFVTMGLQYEGHETFIASTGQEGLDAFRQHAPELVVLDLMLPDVDGIEVCRRLRTFTQVPILMLTARGEMSDKVLGLDSGADDYLAKPFRLPELLARVRALLRRTGSQAAHSLTHGDLKMDVRSREVTFGERSLDLTRKEFDRPHRAARPFCPGGGGRCGLPADEQEKSLTFREFSAWWLKLTG